MAVVVDSDRNKVYPCPDKLLKQVILLTANKTGMGRVQNFFRSRFFKGLVIACFAAIVATGANKWMPSFEEPTPETDFSALVEEIKTSADKIQESSDARVDVLQAEMATRDASAQEIIKGIDAEYRETKRTLDALVEQQDVIKLALEQKINELQAELESLNEVEDRLGLLPTPDGLFAAAQRSRAMAERAQEVELLLYDTRKAAELIEASARAVAEAEEEARQGAYRSILEAQDRQLKDLSPSSPLPNQPSELFDQ